MTTDEFADLVHRHRLLTRPQWQEFAADLRPQQDSVRGLAGELIARGWLTPYQVNCLARGEPGRLVAGPYILLDRLGRGGMVEVFRARHRWLGRAAAVKLLREDRTHMAARFRRWGRLAALLGHPHVAAVYDAGTAAGRPYLATEFLAGGSLEDRVRRSGPLPAAEACACARQAALGLQHAHERGVVHRDIKPSNLLLDADGVVKVADWGLARLLAGGAGPAEPALTRAGRGLGSRDYVAPEQLTDARSADARADLYSLGGTLYYLLTGREPFAGGGQRTKLLKHLGEEPEPVARWRPGVPPEVQVVLACLMAKDPGNRYQTAAEAADALDRAADTRPDEGRGSDLA